MPAKEIQAAITEEVIIQVVAVALAALAQVVEIDLTAALVCHSQYLAHIIIGAVVAVALDTLVAAATAVSAVVVRALSILIKVAAVH